MQWYLNKIEKLNKDLFEKLNKANSDFSKFICDNNDETVQKMIDIQNETIEYIDEHLGYKKIDQFKNKTVN